MIVNILQWGSELGIHNQTERKVTWNIKQAKIWMVARAHRPLFDNSLIAPSISPRPKAQDRTVSGTIGSWKKNYYDE